MSKKEIIWREILFQAIEQKNWQFTQKELAAKFGFSLSTVFNALKAPRQIGAIKVTGRNFQVIDIEKFLYLWATARNLKKDIIYQTRVDESVLNIEGLMPPSAIYGAYSAYRLKFKNAPADYDKVYIYSADTEEIKKRFPMVNAVKIKTPNLIVLKADEFLKNYGQTTTLAQTFVDLWNLSEWYAKDFLNAIKGKIFE
jgi:hypothetical protein